MNACSRSEGRADAFAMPTIHGHGTKMSIVPQALTSMASRQSSQLLQDMRTVSCEIGGAKRDRTADLLHAMQALSQLSYSPIRVVRHSVRSWEPRACRPEWRLDTSSFWRM